MEEGLDVTPSVRKILTPKQIEELTEEYKNSIASLTEMYPSIDKKIIKTVFDKANRNINQAIDELSKIMTEKEAMDIILNDPDYEDVYKWTKKHFQAQEWYWKSQGILWKDRKKLIKTIKKELKAHEQSNS